MPGLDVPLDCAAQIAFRKPHGRFVNDTHLQSTLREMRGLVRNRRSWIVLLALGIVVGLIGPFGTFENMGLVPRLLYWMAVVLGTAGIGTLVAGFVERLLLPRLPAWLAGAIAGAVAGPAIAGVVLVINLVAYGVDVTPIRFGTLLAYCTLISISVTVMSALLWQPPQAKPVPEAVSAAATEPAILERLPRGQRGRLVHIAVSDHYVDVTTEKGTTLVLMRLSDAIRETAPVAGMQVHRSHWVALDAVRRGARQGSKPVLELENGAIVPVSRTYVEAVRAAGLLT
ncbi:LytTR family DNA-binding domain-containing protein [Devosia sp.]|uniref:LytTR family DNA-binding domain-containing protein n=1 Tax=Devosia sp. TaxID=1871048 RepID=UPI0025BCBD28|nr:LytTR family DNA-binding domain-containing protein [Devosia sp.]